MLFRSIVVDGVTHSETITLNTTLNDLISIFESYGMEVTLNQLYNYGEYQSSLLNINYDGDFSIEDGTVALATTFFNTASSQTNKYTSNAIDVQNSYSQAITRDTKLSDINGGTFEAGYLTVSKDGVSTNISVETNDTVGMLLDKLALYGFESVVDSAGKITMSSAQGYALNTYTGEGDASNAISLLGLDASNWTISNSYVSEPVTYSNLVPADRNTALSEIGITTGQYNIYSNGVKYTATISYDDTIGTFIDTLKTFGFDVTTKVEFFNGVTGYTMSLRGNGDSRLESVSGGSNIVNTCFNNPSQSFNRTYYYTEDVEEITSHNADENTLIGDIVTPELESIAGTLAINVNGNDYTLNIENTDTVGGMLNKFREIGLDASILDGQVKIQSGFNTVSIDSANSTSSLANDSATVALNFVNDFGNFTASSEAVMSTVSKTEKLSAANYLDNGTVFSTLNITSGTLSVYKNGNKTVLNVDSEWSLTNLNNELAGHIGGLAARMQDGYLEIFSTDGSEISVGSTTDTSNFMSITGMQKQDDGVVRSARKLYCVNSDSLITGSSLFRSGNVSTGSFKIGNANFEIADTTTIQDLVNQINSSTDANATAWWDNITGEFVIESKSTGAAYVNIEADTSNFTTILGLTNGSAMNVDAQKIGDNAKFSLNGTEYTSTSNTIGSDVSRLEGVTINLKKVSEGESVKLTVEHDKDKAADAMEEIVNSYNELMENVDNQLATTGNLHNETTLRMIRTQLKNLMSSSESAGTTFKTLASIGIDVAQASGGNVSTENSSIVNLSFDRSSFLNAFNSDQNALKTLLIGDSADSTTGILNRIENYIEQTLAANTGYFAIQEKSNTNKITDYNTKISKQNTYIERYRAQLEARFKSMDMLISQMNQQYSSFLSG